MWASRQGDSQHRSPAAIKKVLTQLKQQEAKAETIQRQQLNLVPDSCASLDPQISLFD